MLNESERDELLKRIEQLLYQTDNLTKWEEDFLLSVELQVTDHGWISDRQMERVCSLEMKVGIRLEEP